MDDIFKNLEKDGKNDVDNLVKWIKDSKLIDGTKEAEEKARTLFKDAADLKNIELDKFKSVVQKLAEDQKKNFDDISKQLAAEGPKFMKAAMAGVSAFKDAMTAKLVDGSKELEEKARKLFSDAEDSSNIDLDEFKGVIKKFADDQKKTFDELSQQLAEEGPTVVKAVIAGVSAFKDVMVPPEKPPDLQGQAQKLMSDVASAMSDEIDKFSKEVKRFAEDEKSYLETASSKIKEEIPKIGRAVKEGVDAFIDAVTGK